jgi:transposase
MFRSRGSRPSSLSDRSCFFFFTNTYDSVQFLSPSADRDRSFSERAHKSLRQSVTRRTVFNYLKKLGYEYKVKLKKQWLSAKHRERRVAWCKQYAHFSKEDWHNVIFSDESTFYVLQRKNQVKIWRTDEERLHQDCIQQVNTGNGGKVGIWGGISGQGTTEAKIFDENMDGHMYCNILSGELKRSMAKLHDKANIIYQQDLAPWHTSKIVKAKIDKMRLTVLDWPAKSPDLNPIEMVWSILDKKFMATPIYNKDTLRKRLDQEWKALGIELCRKLLDSMPDRLQKCLRAKGGHFC